MTTRMSESDKNVTNNSSGSHFLLYELCYNDNMSENEKNNNLHTNTNVRGISKMDILRCENLTKEYGKGDNVIKALDNVSFSVEKGEFVSIVGPSGSGKSTLLHILGGVDKPTSGKVFIEDTDVHSLKEDK